MIPPQEQRPLPPPRQRLSSSTQTQAKGEYYLTSPDKIPNPIKILTSTQIHHSRRQRRRPQQPRPLAQRQHPRTSRRSREQERDSRHTQRRTSDPRNNPRPTIRESNNLGRTPRPRERERPHRHPIRSYVAERQIALHNCPTARGLRRGVDQRAERPLCRGHLC